MDPEVLEAVRASRSPLCTGSPFDLYSSGMDFNHLFTTRVSFKELFFD